MNNAVLVMVHKSSGNRLYRDIMPYRIVPQWNERHVQQSSSNGWRNLHDVNQVTYCADAKFGSQNIGKCIFMLTSVSTYLPGTGYFHRRFIELCIGTSCLAWWPTHRKGRNSCESILQLPNLVSESRNETTGQHPGLGPVKFKFPSPYLFLVKDSSWPATNFSSWAGSSFEILGLLLYLISLVDPMAPATTSTGTELSSPVRFESPTPELCPRPLRLHQSKSKSGSESIAEASSRVSDVSNAGQTEPCSRWDHSSFSKAGSTYILSRSRPSKLGSLVSKFEVLDMVSNAEPNSSRLLRPGSKLASQASSLPIATTRSHRALRQSQPSPGQADNDGSSSEHVKLPGSTLKHSNNAIDPSDEVSATANLPRTPISRQSPRSGMPKDNRDHHDRTRNSTASQKSKPTG